jgi:hypothetical protein
MTDLPRKPARLALRVNGTRIGDAARPVADNAATAGTAYGTKRLALRSNTTTLQSLAKRSGTGSICITDGDR